MRLEIKDISNLGQGIAYAKDGQKIFVPKSVAGDIIEAKIIKKTKKFLIAKIINFITKSDLRKEPECQYFSRCGGCALQHLEEDFYYNFKKDNFVKILEKAGIFYDSNIDFIKIVQNSRRRVTFQIDNNNNLGFFEQNSHNLVKIQNCLMLESKLEKLILPLQNLLYKLPKKFIKSIFLCNFDNVIEAVFELENDDISLEVNQKLLNFVKYQENFNINLKIAGKISQFYQIAKPLININGLKIIAENGVFLQATKMGQDAIIAQISDYLQDKNIANVADIYCGIGTYSFAIYDKIKKISAFEGSLEMVNSFNNNAKKYQINHKIIAQNQDLVIKPLQVEELKNFDLAIINPPRNGAKAQIEQLAKSKVENIIMISCNPNSFARDAKVLIENGFRMIKLNLIDQFYNTAHLEVVAIFQK